MYRSAGLPPMRSLRSFNALHLEAALRPDATGILTYDRRLAEAATSLGLDAISPGVR